MAKKPQGPIQDTSGQVKRFEASHPNYGYLGHFRQPKFLQAGHNTSGTMSLDPEATKNFELGFKKATGQLSDNEKAEMAKGKRLAQAGKRPAPDQDAD